MIALSREYKESTNCRLEAEYAFQQKKPIVFIKPQVSCVCLLYVLVHGIREEISHTQKDYKPTGWLGLMLGEKLYYDISSGLQPAVLAKIVEAVGQFSTVSEAPQPQLSESLQQSWRRASSPQDKPISALTVAEVSAWAAQQGLSPTVVKRLADHAVDGTALSSLGSSTLVASASSLMSLLGLATMAEALALARTVQSLPT